MSFVRNGEDVFSNSDERVVQIYMYMDYKTLGFPLYRKSKFASAPALVLMKNLVMTFIIYARTAQELLKTAHLNLDKVCYF